MESNPNQIIAAARRCVRTFSPSRSRDVNGEPTLAHKRMLLRSARPSLVAPKASLVAQKADRGAETEKAYNDVLCPICLQDFGDDATITVTSCRHAFCTDCLESWKGRGGHKCPLCSTALDGTVAPARNAYSASEFLSSWLGVDEQPRFANMVVDEHDEQPRFISLSAYPEVDAVYRSLSAYPEVDETEPTFRSLSAWSQFMRQLHVLVCARQIVADSRRLRRWLRCAVAVPAIRLSRSRRL